MELVNYQLEFGCWLFGHYHDNRTIDLRHILLLEDIKQLTIVPSRYNTGKAERSTGTYPCFSLLCHKIMAIMPERRESNEYQKTN